MPRFFVIVLLGGAFMVSAASASADDATAGGVEETFFETRIRPVLAGVCVECHGPDVASGGLRLDTREGLLEGGEHGPAVVPGDAEGSLLVRAIRHDEKQPIQMPPEEPLSEAVVADLTAWIAAGAKWPATLAAPLAGEKTHWAFQPLERPAPPEDPTGWAEGAIDRFIAAARASMA
jgi:mono/diheme cytochrome c family protein